MTRILTGGPAGSSSISTTRVRYRRGMQRSLMTTTPDFSGVRLLLP
jgi:hypothetical protein